MIAHLLLVATLSPAPVQRSVEQIADDAEAAFEAKRYAEAAAGFAEAFARQPHPGYLYAQAQAERFGGNCRDAIEHYREFIALSPGEGPTRNAERNIGECEKTLALETKPDPEPPSPAVAPEPELEPPPDRVDTPPPPKPRPWYRDPWGGTLVGLGVVGLAVGGGLYGQAVADEKAAANADDVDAYGHRIERASTLSRAGIAMFAVGGALTVAGIIRWSVLAARGRETHATSRGPTFVLRF